MKFKKKITGDSLRPDLLLEVHNKCLYILELTIGYETNLTSNIARKDRKYQDLIRTLKCQYNNVKFINLSVSTLGVLSSHSTVFITMLRELSIHDRHLTYIQKRCPPSGPLFIFFADEDKIGQIQSY